MSGNSEKHFEYLLWHSTHMATFSYDWLSKICTSSMYGFDLAGIESALYWYAKWLQGGYWQVRWIKWTRMGTPMSKSSTIHPLSLPGRASATPYAWQRTQKWPYVVKGQSKYSKCFSEGWVIQVGLVGGVPTELQHHYLS